MFKLSKLPNGLKVLTVPMDGVQSVTAMVWVRVGSRYETEKQNGIAHFLEHAVFKGTDKYTDQDVIARTIEGIGGLLNAYTSLEYTAYFCKVTREHFAKSLDLISELALHPKLPADEIEKEKGNVIEEINKYEDLPDRKSEEEFYQLLYPNQPLGRYTTGTKESVNSFKREDFVTFRNSYYSPDRMTVVVAGAVSEEDVNREVGKIFGGIKQYQTGSAEAVVEQQEKPAIRIYPKKTTAQAHMFLGFRAFPHTDPDQYKLAVLNSYLGEGMSSRLFINVRNKKGLAYTVHSAIDLMTDAGFWGAYAGLNTAKLTEGITGILEEVRQVKQEKVGAQDLIEAKEKIRGPLLFELESTYKMAEYYGQKMVLGEEMLSPEEEAERIMAVTAEDVQKVAQRLFINEHLNLAVVGPYSEKDKEQMAEVLKV